MLKTNAWLRLFGAGSVAIKKDLLEHYFPFIHNLASINHIVVSLIFIRVYEASTAMKVDSRSKKKQQLFNNAVEGHVEVGFIWNCFEPIKLYQSHFFPLQTPSPRSIVFQLRKFFQ